VDAILKGRIVDVISGVNKFVSYDQLEGNNEAEGEKEKRTSRT
jgi:hypothetical protein